MQKRPSPRGATSRTHLDVLFALVCALTVTSMYEDGARIERVPEADVLLRLVDGCAFHGGRTRRTGGRPFLLHLQRRRSATRGRRETGGVDTRRRRVGHLRAKHSGRAYAPCAPGTRRGVRHLADDGGLGGHDPNRRRPGTWAAHLGPLGDELDHGWDQPIGEGGVALSAGQRQLTAMARALAHNPSFLILDEATSNIDPETESKVRQTLADLVEGHTAIVIAHRLSTVRRATRVLVMHHGEVREEGTHEELLAQGGLYARLYRLQFSGQEAAGDAV